MKLILSNNSKEAEQIVNLERKKEEQLFLQQYHSEHYEKPSVAVDLLIFTIENEQLKVLLIKRAEHPYKDCFALPGVFVKIDESVEEAAKRALFEETSLQDIYLEQLYTFGDLNRDPRMRVISIAYMALVPEGKLKPSAGERVSELGWFSVNELVKEEIAFDHASIISCATERIKNKSEYTPIIFQLMPEEFTLSELQKSYEIVLEKPLYKANFRKKIMPMVRETGNMSAGENHRPSKFYEYNGTAYEGIEIKE